MVRVFSVTPYYYSNFPSANLPNQRYQCSPFFFKSSDKIISKNFLMFILFLKFWNKSSCFNQQFNIKTTLFKKPKTQNIFNFLRAPYKNKLARNQLYTPLYKYSIHLEIYSDKIFEANSPHFFLILVNFFLKNFLFFESNVSFLSKIRFNINGNVRNFWNYSLKL